MTFERPLASKDRTGGSSEKWKPLATEWAIQPWTLDAMRVVLSAENPTFEKVAEAIHESTVVQTSARDGYDRLRTFCAAHYGDSRDKEMWREKLLIDVGKQIVWLEKPENKTRALRSTRSRILREAVLEKYKELGQEVVL